VWDKTWLLIRPIHDIRAQHVLLSAEHDSALMQMSNSLRDLGEGIDNVGLTT
jgi:hypothetical protein